MPGIVLLLSRKLVVYKTDNKTAASGQNTVGARRKAKKKLSE
jgi:hypothetical protein